MRLWTGKCGDVFSNHLDPYPWVCFPAVTQKPKAIPVKNTGNIRLIMHFEVRGEDQGHLAYSTVYMPKHIEHEDS